MRLIPWYLLNWPWPFKVDIFLNLQTIWHLTLFHWGKGEKIKPFHKKIIISVIFFQQAAKRNLKIKIKVAVSVNIGRKRKYAVSLV